MTTDHGMEQRIQGPLQTGPSKDMSEDDRLDLVECEVCHRTFKKRGIRIHLAKSACGKTVNQTSGPQRTDCKSMDEPTPESNHRGRIIREGRRHPFIVSQEFHRTPQQDVSVESESEDKTVGTSWSAFLREDIQPEHQETQEETEQETPRRKGWVQKPVTAWFRAKPKDQPTEVEVQQRETEEKKESTCQEKSIKRSTKLTKYFGVKVKGENSLNEWLTALGKLSPKNKEDSQEVPSARRPANGDAQQETGRDTGDQWEITDVWMEEEGDILKLSKRELDDLSKRVRQGSPKELLADHHLHVLRSDLQSLYDKNYLNDTIIDEYLLMIKARSPEAVAVMNTYFYQKFDSLGFERGYEETRTWIKEDLCNKEMIFIPICKNDHWRLIHIDTQQKTVSYFDSIIGSRKSSNAPKLMKRFIEKYFQEQGKPQVFKIKIQENIPTQQNGVDCGVFLCTYAERLSRHVWFNFNQSNMSLFRWKMTWEILHGSLKEFIQVMGQDTNTTTKTRVGKQQGSKVEKLDGKGQEESEGRKKQIQWPAANSDEWSKLDLDLTTILRNVGNTAEKKAELHPQVIYNICLSRFGEVETKKQKVGKPSRRQTKGQKLRQQINNLRHYIMARK